MKGEGKETFEGALKKLEEIVRRLEEDNASLDESLTLFEEGKALIDFCLNKLDTAEQKFKTLSSQNKK